MAFYSWFVELYKVNDSISELKISINSTSPYYTLLCNSALPNQIDSNIQIYSDGAQYYILSNEILICTIVYHQSGNLTDQIMFQSYFQEFIQSNNIMNKALKSDNSKILQITLSLAGIEFVLIIAAINYYAKSIALIVASPIDELTHSLRNIDQNNIDEYFSERLQGESSKLIPDEMILLLRSVYDFIGIVKIANEAFIQGNDGQAIIGYAVANQFYLENGNKLGAGVIQNNMGVIHIRNRRFQEAIFCFKEAIICIQNEWEKYKHKYSSVGIHEDELIVDQEYQNLSKIVFNRCFNLCEALGEFLLSEILELQELLFTDKTQRKSLFNVENMMYTQIENTHATRQKAVSVFNQDKDEEQEEIEKIIKIKGNAKRNVNDLQKLNDIMFTIRQQFLGTHDFKNNIIIHNIETVNEKEIEFLINQLWRDTIKTYEYCQEIMQFHLNKTKQKQLYITLKLIIGYLQNGQMNKSEDLIKIAYEQYNKIQQQNDDRELGHISLLEQKLYLYHGLILYKKNIKLEAAQLLIKSLCVNGKFSSRDRLQALIMLKAIFQYNNKSLIKINDFLIQFQPIAKDWIFILDGSKNMKQDLAIVRASRTFHNFIKNINSANDRVSLGILRENYYEFVPLIGKVENASYIDKTFQLIPKPKGICNTTLISSIADKYFAHPNLITIGNNRYLTKDGVAIMRYKKVIIFACWKYENVAIKAHDDIIIIYFGRDYDKLQLRQQVNVLLEDDWNKVLNKYQQLLTEQNDSNYFLEQIL
ncbi:unnamed protein product [Paramecium sonneborni]|uniref:Tetratricopeptide repeat protein n=1 Tax=Paramecium sonneborni TaxID=65129 RepID=A0A8S1LEL2_9CILI|nr:unnamed protein product [Paramecium sonneborni]